MYAQWIAAVLSFLAPGAGQTLQGKPVRGALWLVVLLPWGALAAFIMFKAMSLMGPGSESALRLMMMALPLAGMVLPAICGWDAYRLSAEPPRRAQWIQAVLFAAAFWTVGARATQIINGIALQALLGPQAGEVLAARRQTDALVGQIEKMGKGVFAADEKNGFLIDRYDDKFPLPPGYRGKGEPLEGVEEGQTILLYPPSVGQRMALPSANDPLQKWLEMGLVSVAIEQDPDAASPDRVARFQSMLKIVVEKTPEMGGSVSKRDDLRWPSLMMTFKQPSHVRVYVFGAKKRYVFTAAASGELLEAILKGFQEG